MNIDALYGLLIGGCVVILILCRIAYWSARHLNRRGRRR